MLTDYIPETPVLIALLALKLATLENQHWTRAIRNGRRGASDLITGFALITEIAVVLFLLGNVLFLGWNGEWRLLGGMVAIWVISGVTLGMGWAMLVPDSFMGQFLGTLACWPLAVFIAKEIFQHIG